MPATIPDDDPMVATPVDPEAHDPPPASFKAVADPGQTEAVPLIAEGKGLTVTDVVALQPVPSV